MNKNILDFRSYNLIYINVSERSRDMNRKVVLITGASSGIGKATCEKLAKEGYIVYGVSRTVKEIDELKASNVNTVKMDITNKEEVHRCIDIVLKREGRIDVLFNNAGFGLYGSAEDINIEDAKYQFEVNLFGLARITRLVLKHMRENNSGLIINTSSMGGKIYTPLGGWYHASKHALEAWSDCLRIDVKQFGIDVVIIEPGIIKTSFQDVMREKLLESSKDGAYKEMAAKIADSTRKLYKPERASSPEIIAEVVLKA